MRRDLIVFVTVSALVLGACASNDNASDAGTPTPAVGSTATGPEATDPSDASASTTQQSSTSAAPAGTEVPESSTTEAPNSEPTVSASSSSQTTADLTADRPFDVFVPSAYDSTTPTPLVLLLHGYTASGDIQESYFQFEPLAESRGFLYVHPDGTVDAAGAQYWNATDACCSFGTNTPDDSAYVKAVIDQVSQDYNVDPKRIFLAGHSNGGFMSYRMACDHADTIAAVASLAGATFGTSATCTPSEPVSVLQVHGTDDAVIGYGGDDFRGAIVPSAEQTVALWAGYNGCDPSSTDSADQLDLDIVLEGVDSDISSFDGCASGSDVELWTINGGSHSPALSDQFKVGVIDFLLAHPKP